jgi:hypothetical protein
MTKLMAVAMLWATLGGWAEAQPLCAAIIEAMRAFRALDFELAAGRSRFDALRCRSVHFPYEAPIEPGAITSLPCSPFGSVESECEVVEDGSVFTAT